MRSGVKKGEIHNVATDTLLQSSSDSNISSLLTPLLFPSTPYKSEFIELEINIEIKLSYIRGVNEYYWELIRNIEEFKRQSWTYKEISDHLHSRGFTSRRGKRMSPQLVERMYKKYLKKLDNESIKDISIKLIKS